MSGAALEAHDGRVPGSGNDDACDCGTDCATGTVSQCRSYLATPHGDLSLGFYNLITQDGSLANRNFCMGTPTPCS